VCVCVCVCVCARVLIRARDVHDDVHDNQLCMRVLIRARDAHDVFVHDYQLLMCVLIRARDAYDVVCMNDMPGCLCACVLRMYVFLAYMHEHTKHIQVSSHTASELVL